jgi:hypothetical protein
MDLHPALLAYGNGVGSGWHLKEEIEALPTAGAGWFNTLHPRVLFSPREVKTVKMTGPTETTFQNP